MSDTNNIGDILQRVEQMLDALQAPAQSSRDFKAGCDSLQAYLDDRAGVFAAAGDCVKLHHDRGHGSFNSPVCHPLSGQWD